MLLNNSGDGGFACWLAKGEAYLEQTLSWTAHECLIDTIQH